VLDYIGYLMAQNATNRAATNAQPDAPELKVDTSANAAHFSMLRHQAGRALRRMAETLDPPAAPAGAPLETC
jgi:hypothetical protein